MEIDQARTLRAAMTDRDCLSFLELLDVRNTEPPTDVGAHLARCPRCRVLAGAVPSAGAPAVDQLIERAAAASMNAAGAEVLTPEAPEAPADIQTGQLWLVSASTHWNEIVAVLGDKPDAPELVMASPVWPELDIAAEGDVVVRESPLGYEHVICVWNSGLIDRQQLRTYCGRISPDMREAMVATFLGLTGESATAPPPGAPPILGAEDPRLSWRAWFQDRTRALYRDVDQRLDQESVPEPAPAALGESRRAEQPASPSAATRTRTTTRVLTFGNYLEKTLEGPEWDLVGLAEQAELTTGELQCFLADQLDVKFRKDTEAVVRVVRLVAPEPEEVVEGPVRNTALLCSKGLLTAEGLTPPLAASSFAGVSEETRAEDLYHDELQLDDSAQAAKQAAELYVAEVLAAL